MSSLCRAREKSTCREPEHPGICYTGLRGLSGRLAVMIVIVVIVVIVIIIVVIVVLVLVVIIGVFLFIVLDGSIIFGVVLFVIINNRLCDRGCSIVNSKRSQHCRRGEVCELNRDGLILIVY